jgi:hypothetical protein
MTRKQRENLKRHKENDNFVLQELIHYCDMTKGTKYHQHAIMALVVYELRLLQKYRIAGWDM